MKKYFIIENYELTLHVLKNKYKLKHKVDLPKCNKCGKIIEDKYVIYLVKPIGIIIQRSFHLNCIPKEYRAKLTTDVMLGEH